MTAPIFSPFAGKFSFSPRCHSRIVLFVSVLFPVSRPATVFRTIAKIILDPIQSEARLESAGKRPIVERLKRREPFWMNFDPATSVAHIANILRVIATRLHGLPGGHDLNPYGGNGRRIDSVGLTHFACLVRAITSAGLLAFVEFLKIHENSHAARAQTFAGEHIESMATRLGSSITVLSSECQATERGSWCRKWTFAFMGYETRNDLVGRPGIIVNLRHSRITPSKCIGLGPMVALNRYLGAVQAPLYPETA